MNQYAAGHLSGATPQSRVELHFSATNLLNMDLLSKSDPQLIIYLDGKEIGRTETIQDNLNPQWTKR